MKWQTFSGFVKKMCTGIRNAETLEHELAFAQELLGSLEKTNYTTLSEADKQLYIRAAYGLFVGNLDLTATNPAMQEAKKLAIPIALNGELVVMQTPLGKLVVLEKLTTQNQPAWLKYAETEYTYLRLGGDFDDFMNMPEGPEKEPLMWIEFRKDISGIMYFHSRIQAGIENRYDKWIAYVYSRDIATLTAERKSAEIINPDHIEMVMTVQASKDFNAYSPIGISRTVDCAKKMLKNKTDGKSEDKIEPPIAVWFHALTCKIVQTKYSNIDRFWTLPVHTMRRILIKALFPHIKFPSTQKKTSSVGRFYKTTKYPRNYCK
jgi:hypothetical protein